MKAMPAGLQAHLDSGATTVAWCWRIARRDEVVLGFTDHDRSLTFGGTEFEPESGLSASELRAGVDLAVDDGARDVHAAAYGGVVGGRHAVVRGELVDLDLVRCEDQS